MMVMTYVNQFSKMVQLVPLLKSDVYTVDDKFLSKIFS